MRSAACKDAEIFIVALGTMDVVGECVGMPVAAMRKTALDTFEEDEICDTVKNLREICDALRAEGKKVGGPGPLCPHLLGLVVSIRSWVGSLCHHILLRLDGVDTLTLHRVRFCFARPRSARRRETGYCSLATLARFCFRCESCNNH